MIGPQPSSEPRPSEVLFGGAPAVASRAYRFGNVIDRHFGLDRVSDYLEQADTVVWIDLCRPATAQLDAIAAELGLHDLAVEDALESHQRPKLDHYDSHLFLSCHALSTTGAAANCTTPGSTRSSATGGW
jgi:magnesium transporter